MAKRVFKKFNDDKAKNIFKSHGNIKRISPFSSKKLYQLAENILLIIKAEIKVVLAKTKIFDQFKYNKILKINYFFTVYLLI